MPLFTLIGLVVVVWLVLMGLLAVLTLFFQGYVYTEPVEGITWRAPAAGSLVAFSLLVWVLIDYSSRGRYSDLLKFNPTSTITFKELVVVTRQEPGKPSAYKLDRAGKAYVRSDGTKLSSRPLSVTVKEDGQDVVFEPDRDAKGNFKESSDRNLYYRDKKGRVMREDNLGVISSFSTGNLIGYLLLNVFHFAAWFVALWLLLDFRMSHALGLAIVFVVVVQLLLLPPMLGYTEKVADEQAPKASGTSSLPGILVAGRPSPAERGRA